jgi:DNA processing protein
MQLAGNFDSDLPSKSWMTSVSANLRFASQITHPGHRRALAEDGFPARLRGIPSPPEVLWWRGRLPAPGERLIAIVGARAATRAGCDRARALATELGQGGFSIVSGGAFGIDAAAHEGALAAGAATYAVLGCGIDVVYPDRHADLFSRIALGGGLLSEYAPGTPPRPGQFPARNRLIAGLAEAILVVEAASRSGALITARLARAQGRPLFAVPGSPGTDAFVRRGHAVPVTSATELLAGLAGAPVVASSSASERPESELLDAIARGINTVPALCQCFGTTLPAMLAMLAEAELEGCVCRAASNTYEVTRRVC